MNHIRRIAAVLAGLRRHRGSVRFHRARRVRYAGTTSGPARHSPCPPQRPPRLASTRSSSAASPGWQITLIAAHGGDAHRRAGRSPRPGIRHPAAHDRKRLGHNRMAQFRSGTPAGGSPLMAGSGHPTPGQLANPIPALRSTPPFAHSRHCLWPGPISGPPRTPSNVCTDPTAVQTRQCSPSGFPVRRRKPTRRR